MKMLERRIGKALMMRQWLDEQIAKGETVGICTTDPQGRPHVCTVYPLRRKK